LKKINQFTESHGSLKPGSGLVTGVVALSLGILCFLGVLAFHFPQYLTTPELRRNYDVATIRHIMFAAMVLAGGLSLVNLLFNCSCLLSIFAFLLVVLIALLEMLKVTLIVFADGTQYSGLDWLILDLQGSALIFTFIVKLIALFKDQR